MTMNQNAALSDAQPQPLASSRPKNARPRVCVLPGWSACCAIVLHSADWPPRPPAISYLTVRVPVIVVGWTSHTKL